MKLALLMSLILCSYVFAGEIKEDSFKSSTLIFKHKLKKKAGYTALKEAIQVTVNDPKKSIKVDNPEKPKIVADFTDVCEAGGMLNANIIVFYNLTANFKDNKTRLKLDIEKLHYMDVDMELKEDNGALDKYTKCRHKLLKTLEKASLNTTKEDEW